MAAAEGDVQQTISIHNMEPNLERPKTSLARGVQITEFKESKVNPEPVIMEDTDLLMEAYLSPRKLRMLTGVDNLEEIHSLEVKVDTSETSLGNFGQYLPNLSQLKLSNSYIPCIRDLGSSFRNLRVLWMNRCGLQELDGVSSMVSLRELYLSYNELSEISPLSMLEDMQVLDLEGNCIDDVVQVQYLALCLKLKQLNLDGNPVCLQPSPDSEEENYDYRHTIHELLPQVQTLDDDPLEDGPSTRRPNAFEEDWRYLEELQNDALLQEVEEAAAIVVPGGERPGTALRPATSYRPGSVLRPGSASVRPGSASRRPGSASRRPGSAARPGTSARPGSASRPRTSAANRPSIDGIDSMDAASELTLGGVICGNPSRALKSRQRPSSNEGLDLDTKNGDMEFFKEHKVEDSEETNEYDKMTNDEFLEELKTWREHQESRIKEIQESKAAQVLVIDHAEDVLTDSDDEPLTPRETKSAKRTTAILQASQQDGMSPEDFGATGITGQSHDETFDAHNEDEELNGYPQSTPPSSSDFANGRPGTSPRLGSGDERSPHSPHSPHTPPSAEGRSHRRRQRSSSRERSSESQAAVVRRLSEVELEGLAAAGGGARRAPSPHRRLSSGLREENPIPASLLLPNPRQLASPPRTPKHRVIPPIRPRVQSPMESVSPDLSDPTQPTPVIKGAVTQSPHSPAEMAAHPGLPRSPHSASHPRIRRQLPDVPSLLPSKPSRP